jgi:TusA-related sulfurtransferase
MMGFDLTAVPSERQGRMFAHCYDLLDVAGARAWFCYTRRWLLGDMYRGAKERPFRLLETTRASSGAWRAVIETRHQRDFDYLLVLRRYRCPGPVAELMASLRVLKPGERLQLLAFGEAMDPERLRLNVAAEGYVVEEYAAFHTGTVAVRIGVGNRST